MKQHFLGNKISKEAKFPKKLYFLQSRISEEDNFSMKLKLPDSVKGIPISNHRKLNILGPFLIKLRFLGSKIS